MMKMMKKKGASAGGGILGPALMLLMALLLTAPDPATGTPLVIPQGRAVQSEANREDSEKSKRDKDKDDREEGDDEKAKPVSFRITYPAPPKPPIERIPRRGAGEHFQLVGHNPLLDNHLIPDLRPMGIPRGANGNIAAAAGPCVYVGNLAGSLPALVVDVSNPRNPTVVGPVPGHVPGIGHGIDAIDSIPELDLMVIHMRPAVFGGFNPQNATSLQIYDISNCRRPRLVMNFPLGQEAGNNSALHMSTIWRDPANPARVLHTTSFLAVHHPGLTPRPDDIDIRVVDLTGCPRQCNPRVVAEWGLEAEEAIPTIVDVRYPDGTTFPRPTVTHQATFSVDGTRMWVAALGAGFFGLDSELLAKNLPCDPRSPRRGEPPELKASHCLKLLNPNFSEHLDSATGVNIPGRADWDPPFFSAHTHTAANVPGGRYVVVADEPNTAAFVACPWSWMRLMYVGDKETGNPIFLPPSQRLPYRGDLFPSVLGVMASAQNVPGRCPTPGVPAGRDTYGPEITRDDHGPHEPLVFPNLVIATYYSDGLKAFSIANPLTPVEVGSFYNKPVETVRFCWTNCLAPITDAQGRTVQIPPDLSVGPVDLRAFSRPIARDGLIYYVDSNSGLYILKYTGPHAEEIPERGTCVTGNIHVAGFEPCPPYR